METTKSLHEEHKEKKILLEEFYRPPREIQEKIFDVYEKYIKWRALREQSYKQFNGVRLEDWLQQSREKFWGYLPISYDLDVPQFFFPETRNQIIGILAKIANLKLKPRFEGVENFDIVKATILKDLFEYWKRKSNKKIKSFWQFLYNIINGTTIVFVGYKNLKRDVKTVTMYDPNTGKTEYKAEKIDDSDVDEIICNLEDIYIPKLWEPDIQEQEELIWRTLFKWSDFKNAFAGYTLANYVVPGMQFADTSIFKQFLAYDVQGSDFVEVIKYFNVPKDQYMIIANGVLLNPLKNKDGKEEICPLPWNHKKLPFAKTIFEPLDASFFYGLSLPQKVKYPQEALNKMWELLLEREIRSVSAPIITNDPNIEMGLEFKPGRIYQVGTDVNQYKELLVSPSSSSYWNSLMSLQGIISRTASGGVSPIIPSRQPRSATEKAAEETKMRETMGLHYLFYEDLLEQIAWLVIQNMIQFYTAEKTEKIMGEKKFHKILSLIDVQLTQGGMGNREIRITPTPVDSEELRKEAWYRSLFKKEKVEIIEVSPQALRQMKFDIKIDFEEDTSPEGEKVLFLDYIMTLVKLFGQYGILDPRKMLYRTAEKFGENIADIIPDALISNYERERFGVTLETSTLERPEVPKIPEVLTEEDLTRVGDVNQRRRGMMFGAGGPAAREGLSDLAKTTPRRTKSGKEPTGMIL